MKKFFRLFGVACFGGMALLLPFVWGQDQPPQKPESGREALEKFMKSFGEPIQIGESKPVTVNGAEFVLVAQTNWKPGKPDAHFSRVAPIEIQLRITNLGKEDRIFPTFQTFGISMLNAEGKEVKLRSVRKGDLATRPVLLSEGVSHSLCPQGELRWDDKKNASELVFYDGTGSQSVFGPLVPGRYKLVFWYSVLPNKKEKEKIGVAAAWIGKAITNEVPIDVLDGTTRGYPSASAQPPDGFAEPIRIRESKPVTVNGAKFVVVAQGDWKPGKIGNGVPIEIQLRITNLGKKDILFPTFDAFGARILDADGNKVMPRGGRDLTKFTRPVLIAAGASYSLAAEGGPPSSGHRRTELRWDVETKAAEMVYFDGTGTGGSFGPLKPGRFKLAFWYAVSGVGPFKTGMAPAVWLGRVLTDDVAIEVLKH